MLKYDGAGVSTVRTFTLAGCTTGILAQQVILWDSCSVPGILFSPHYMCKASLLSE